MGRHCQGVTTRLPTATRQRRSLGMRAAFAFVDQTPGARTAPTPIATGGAQVADTTKRLQKWQIAISARFSCESLGLMSSPLPDRPVPSTGSTPSHSSSTLTAMLSPEERRTGPELLVVVLLGILGVVLIVVGIALKVDLSNSAPKLPTEYKEAQDLYAMTDRTLTALILLGIATLMMGLIAWRTDATQRRSAWGQMLVAVLFLLAGSASSLLPMWGWAIALGTGSMAAGALTSVRLEAKRRAR